MKKFVAFSLIGLLALVAMAQIAVTGAGVWLSAPPGQAWLQGQVKSGLSSSGYHLARGHLDFVGLGRVRLHDFAVADTNGIFAEGHNLILTLDVASLLSGTVAATLTGNDLTVDRVPMAQNSAPRPASGPGLVQPFHLPRTPIHAARLTVNVKSLTLAPAVAGQAMALSPDVTASVDQHGDSLSFMLKGQLAEAKPAEPAWLPRTVDTAGTFDAAKAQLALDHLAVKADGYAMSASGNAGLAADGVLALKAAATGVDLGTLAQQPGSANVTIALTGSMASPTADVAGAATLTQMKNLAPIKLTLHGEDLRNAPHGVFDVSTVWQKRAADVSDTFATDANGVVDNELAATSPGLMLKGRVAVDKATNLATGMISANGDLAVWTDILHADLTGKIHAVVTLSSANGKQGAAVTADATALRYQTVSVGTIHAETKIADLRAGLPDVLNVKVQNASVAGYLFKTLALALTRQDATYYKLALNGDGNAAAPFTLSGAAMLENGQQKAAQNINLTLKGGDGSLAVTGDVLPTQLNLNAKINQLPLTVVMASVPPAAVGDRLSGSASVTGPLAKPIASANIALAGGKQALALRATAQIKDGKATGTLQGTGSGIRQLTAQGTLPFTLSLSPFAAAVPAKAQMAGSLNADLDLAALAPFVPADMMLTGRIRAAAKAAGAPAKPQLRGTASITGGSVRQTGSGLSLTDMALDARFAGDTLTVSSFHATDGHGGTLALSGTAGLGAGLPLDLKVKAVNLNALSGSEIVKGETSADLTLKGKGTSYNFAGKVNVGPTDINVPQKFGSTIPELNIVDPNAKPETKPDLLKAIRLAIAIHAPERIFIRGWGLTAEFGGDLQASGTLAEPLLNGTISSRQGRLEQFGKTFTLDHANLRFQGAVPPSPYLDVSANAPANDVTATIALTGSVTSPAFGLSSTPALPQDEVLSQLLFGKSLSSISPFQAIQIAQTLQQFSGKGGGGFDPLGKLRGAAKLDDLSVGQSSSGATTVGAGKYLTNKVYVQAVAGADQKSSAAIVQYELTPHTKLQSEVGQAGQTGGGVLFQWDY